jgi:hypothetical protein
MKPLSLVEVCQYLRRDFGDRAPAYNSLWRLAAEGRIPTSRKGRSYVVEPGDLTRVETALNLRRVASRLPA